MFPPILHRVHKVSWVRQVSLASRMRNVTKPVLQIRGTNFNLSSLKLSNESPNITEMQECPFNDTQWLQHISLKYELL